MSNHSGNDKTPQGHDVPWSFAVGDLYTGSQLKSYMRTNLYCQLVVQGHSRYNY